jgi:hypothetical protein
MAQLGNTIKNTHRPCVHHWLCGDQKHGSVHAVCTKCGTEADFIQGEYHEKFALKSRKVPPTLSPDIEAFY